MKVFHSQVHNCYRNTIAGPPPGEQIFLLKKKVRLSKIAFLNFHFLAKKTKMTLNSLEVTKCCKNLFYSIFVILSSNFHDFFIFYF